MSHEDYMGPEWEPFDTEPVTIQQMVSEITEYYINNLSWAEIKTVLEAYYAHHLSSMPPEALSEAYDTLFNR